MTGSLPAVFDCNVFLQAMLSRSGPAHACWQNAVSGKIRLFVTPRMLLEIRRLPEHPKLRRFKLLTEDRVDRFVEEILDVADLVPDPPPAFVYPRDPDDGHYVDVAVATGALLIVSRDKDLLDLMDTANAAGNALRTAHPAFKILTPPQLLSLLPRAP